MRLRFRPEPPSRPSLPSPRAGTGETKTAMVTPGYHALQSERGRRGGLKTARLRRLRKRDAERALDAVWPRCRECGSRTHMGLCPVCND